MKYLTCLSVMAFSAFTLGCTGSTASNQPEATIDSTKYLVDVEPAGAQNVIAVREAAKDDYEVTVVGRIGGSTNPLVEGRTVFSIVDPSLKACSDVEGDNCESPWDYCCETDKLPTATALIKVVDENGQPLKADAREALNLAELQTVVVHGKAKRDADGNLTVLADQLFVRK